MIVGCQCRIATIRAYVAKTKQDYATTSRNVQGWKKVSDVRLIDADRLLTDRMKSKYYHLPNGDIAIPLIDIEHAPTIEPQRKTGEWITSDDMYETGICSCCRYDTQEPVSYVITNFVYCPNCGSYNGGD